MCSAVSSHEVLLGPSCWHLCCPLSLPTHFCCHVDRRSLPPPRAGPAVRHRCYTALRFSKTWHPNRGSATTPPPPSPPPPPRCLVGGSTRSGLGSADALSSGGGVHPFDCCCFLWFPFQSSQSSLGPIPLLSVPPSLLKISSAPASPFARHHNSPYAPVQASSTPSSEHTRR